MGYFDFISDSLESNALLIIYLVSEEALNPCCLFILCIVVEDEVSSVLNSLSGATNY